MIGKRRSNPPKAAWEQPPQPKKVKQSNTPPDNSAHRKGIPYPTCSTSERCRQALQNVQTNQPSRAPHEPNQSHHLPVKQEFDLGEVGNASAEIPQIVSNLDAIAK